MNFEISKVGVSVHSERIESILGSSFLLLPESKVALLSRMKDDAIDTEEISRIVAFLESERKFMIEFMKRRLHDGSFPEKAPILLQEMRSEFLRKIREQESLERDQKEALNKEIESKFSLAFT
jgi:hypothetical protein